jgi:hypothetical protein
MNEIFPTTFIPAKSLAEFMRDVNADADMSVGIPSSIGVKSERHMTAPELIYCTIEDFRFIESTFTKREVRRYRKYPDKRQLRRIRRESGKRSRHGSESEAPEKGTTVPLRNHHECDAGARLCSVARATSGSVPGLGQNEGES